MGVCEKQEWTGIPTHGADGGSMSLLGWEQRGTHGSLTTAESVQEGYIPAFSVA